MTHNQTVGSLGESLALDALRRRGYEIIEQNWHCRYGEIDIVARDDGSMVFVEVKTRISLKFGTPEEAVTTHKQARMIRCAEAYVAQHALKEIAMRMDIVAVELTPGRELVRLDIYPNAIQG